MLEKSLGNTRGFLGNNWPKVTGLLLWVALGFATAQGLLLLVASLLSKQGLLQSVNSTVLQATFAALVYLLTLAIVLGVPKWLKKSVTNKKEMGMLRLPNWLDIGLAPAGFIIYLVLTTIVTYLAGLLVPGFDPNQVQQTGFTNLAYKYELFLAFITLVVLAPLAEEILFRGYLYGKLRKYTPIWLAVLLTSVLFAVVHWQLNVAVDVFALSLVLCSLREITGNIWAGVLLHILKNSVAYYILFINPTLLNIIGG